MDEKQDKPLMAVENPAGKRFDFEFTAKRNNRLV